MDIFKDQVAVVTGAGGTLCSEIAQKLAAEGAQTVLVGRTAEKLQRIANTITASGGTCMVCAADVTDEDAMNAVAEKVLSVYGPCRYLINGAGGNNNKAITTNFTFEPEELQPDKPEGMVGFFDLDMDVFSSVLTINTLGTVIPVRVFAKQMANGDKDARNVQLWIDFPLYI